jgi:integrase
VIAKVDGIAKRAPIQANRILALISKIFNFALSKEIVEVNPATRVVKPSSERTRERFLNDEEIKAVWRAFENEGSQNAALFKLLLLTTQRRDEVMRMRRDELNLDTGEWLLSGERTKNKRATPGADCRASSRTTYNAVWESTGHDIHIPRQT